MSARKAEGTGRSSSLQHVTVQARQTRLALSPDSVIIHKRGIEFRSATPFPDWTELTLVLHHNNAKVHCQGVVISCTGNKHTGYHISITFTSLSRQAEARLNAMAFSSLHALF
jgi:hypothetical protein